MSERDVPSFDPAGWLDMAAPALGLTITPEQRPGVLRFLETASRMAVVIGAAEAADPDEFALAPVFRPGAEH